MNAVRKDNQEGCILEVDLEYTKELHNVHNDYPIGPEKIMIKESMLPNYFKEITSKNIISICRAKKPVTSLGDKDKDVHHY